MSVAEKPVQETKVEEKTDATEELVKETAQLSIEAEFDRKHPLQNNWTLWWDHPGRKTNQTQWVNHLKKVVDFDTVEDFWGVWNQITMPSKLVAGSNYHMFKEGIEPMWEHPANKVGGKWIATFPRKNKDKLDDCFLYTVLAAIGEQMTSDLYPEEICGTVVSVRKAQDRIALWTKTANDEEACMAIGRAFKAALGLDGITLNYQVHADSLKRNSSYGNQARYQC